MISIRPSSSIPFTDGDHATSSIVLMGFTLCDLNYTNYSKKFMGQTIELVSNIKYIRDNTTGVHYYASTS